MGEIKVLRRKIFLKKQAVTLITEEIRDLQDRLALLRVKGRLEDSIDSGDPAISRKLDCIQVLLEE